MVSITPEEKKLPYYKYFLRDLAPIPQEKLDIWQGPAADGTLALPIEQRDRFLDEAPLPLESGFCVAPNGTGFVANATPLPGVDVPMFEWWFAWHCVGSDLRYKLWDKEDHYQARARETEYICDPNVPLSQKSWGVTHDIMEDIGLGPSPLTIHFKKPSDLGYSMNKLGTTGCLSMTCGVGESDVPALMTHKLMQGPDCLILKSRFWIGYGLSHEGDVIKVIPDGISVPELVPRALFGHNIKEFTNLASFLPEIYAEEGHKPLMH